MQNKNPKELPGFQKKSFSLFFHGGEIWFEHLDGIYEFEDLVLEKLNLDKKTFQRPSVSAFICFNLEETAITDKIIAEIVESLLETTKRFVKVCFVGVDRKTANKLKKALAHQAFEIAFINDFEKAKEWLL